MDKVKRRFPTLSLRASFICHIIICLLLAVLCIGLTQQAITAAYRSGISEKYYTKEQRYYLTNEAGQQLGEGAFISRQPVEMSPADKSRSNLYSFLYNNCSLFYYALAILSAALLFYRNKLRQPLKLLQQASQQITCNNLDFHIVYDKQDEMGQLCIAFEKMRAALLENNRLMWRQMEERKRINAAFAHDLRTPLTILKGYTDMLQFCQPPASAEKIPAMARTMSKQVERVDQYVQSMRDLQHLEDICPNPQRYITQEICEQLRQSAEILCAAPLQIEFCAKWTSKEISIDLQMLQQIYENILTNARRYAQAKIHIFFSEEATTISLAVEDDGPGFSASALQQAMQPYYTEARERKTHYGLGLYICALLCQHHGGGLHICNTDNGAQVIAALKKYT